MPRWRREKGTVKKKNGQRKRTEDGKGNRESEDVGVDEECESKMDGRQGKRSNGLKVESNIKIQSFARKISRESIGPLTLACN